MSSAASQTYARNSQTTATPREIEAQALLKAARQLQDVVENWSGAGSRLNSAILFNRKLWSIFMNEAINDENPLAVDIRQKIANIGIFVMKQTVEIQANPAPEKLKSLIDINCNLAAGLSGRA
jgi:flagellar protein FlaF